MQTLSAMLKQKPKVILFALLLLGLVLVLASYLLPKEEPVSASSLRTQSETEERLSVVLSEIEGAGNVEVLLTEDETGVIGAIIVAEGGEKLTVQIDLIRACCAALQLPAEAVSVFEKEGEP